MTGEICQIFVRIHFNVLLSFHELYNMSPIVIDVHSRAKERTMTSYSYKNASMTSIKSQLDWIFLRGRWGITQSPICQTQFFTWFWGISDHLEQTICKGFCEPVNVPSTKHNTLTQIYIFVKFLPQRYTKLTISSNNSDFLWNKKLWGLN